MSNNTQLKGFPLFMLAIRAFAFPASVIPVLYGSMLAVLLNPGMKFDFFLFFLTLIGSMSVHVSTNLINDIYDFKKGMDREDAETGIPHGGSTVISKGMVSIKAMKIGSIVSIILASLIGVYLYTQSGPFILYLSIFGFLSAIFYTATPIALKYRALGDLQVFLSFGAGITLGAYIVQMREFSWIPVILSVPIGFLIIAILHSNNIRDMKFDGTFNVKTLPILIGEKFSKYVYYFLVLGAYASIVIFVLFKLLPWLALLNFVTLPMALKLIKMLNAFPQESNERFEFGTKHNIMTAQLSMQFGLTLTLGLLISYIMNVVFHI